MDSSTGTAQESVGAASHPRVGMLSIVRNRRAVISGVREFDADAGRLHLVRLDYMDDNRPPSEEVVWELEPSRRLLPAREMPSASGEPMRPEEFDALLRATRWSAVTPFLAPDGTGAVGRLPAASPFHGAVELDDYQLVPLLKALRMPRVNLLLADDVGLGKTIEAGLILSELLIRRRINRILVLTPASLRVQWRDEMWHKFSLPFDLVDRDSSMRLKRSLGIDANPWRCCNRIIASYHYLRQPDVLDQFLSACAVPEGSPHLPWDLLVVDEAHNLMPPPFGDESQLCRTLRQVAPRFEHRLFLTATPHNGHTESFTGLLEMLDPVRFSRTSELRPAEKERVKQIVIRRLKREINARTDPPLFCTRMPPKAIMLAFSPQEQSLVDAFESFRAAVRAAIAGKAKGRRVAGRFALEILGKRMLSGPAAFLDSWSRCKMGLQEQESAEDGELQAAGRSAQEDTDDDREAEQRCGAASVVIGAWLQPIAESVSGEIASIDAAAQGLGIDLGADVVLQDPRNDARFDALCALVEEWLRSGGKWRDDERLVVFTEYKKTLDYLYRRLRAKYADNEGRLLRLFGGMEDAKREAVKCAFNDPGDPVRVLLATDAAAEGLNLQSTARCILHYDCPWNPAKLEQRNGRLDRHGQARDVFVHHFASEQDADLKFLRFLVGKVDQIREDLGAVGELFDEATHRRFIEGEDAEDVQRFLENRLEAAKGAASLDADDAVEDSPGPGEPGLRARLDALARELDLDPGTARDTLETALAMQAGRPQLSEPDHRQRFKILNPALPDWKDVVDEAVRIQSDGGPARLPMLTFTADAFMESIGERRVFRPRNDTLMLHLGHPFMQRAVGVLARRRFPGGRNPVSRWTVRWGDVPQGAEAVIVLHIEELAVNELRETFHHWVRTVRLPVADGLLGETQPPAPASERGDAVPCEGADSRERARLVLDGAEPALRRFVNQWCKDLAAQLAEQLEADGRAAREQEDRRYQSRQGEVSSLIAGNTMEKLQRQIAQLKQQRQQGFLPGMDDELDRLDQDIAEKEQELERRRRHYEELRGQLARERERIVRVLLPKRFALLGEPQVFPVAAEVRLPKEERGGA